MESASNVIELNPTDKALGTVIWLHGLGADANDFVPIVEALQLPKNLPLRFVFPEAKNRAITVNGGMSMRGWYDITSLDLTFEEDEAGIDESVGEIRALIMNEKKQGFTSKQIILAGFSQGGAIALQTGLRFKEPLAGILALSTYIPLADSLAERLGPHVSDVPILMIHGLFDPVVPLQLANQAKAQLEEWDAPVVFKTYPMPHAVCDEEIALISKWLSRAFLGEEKV